MLEKRLTTRITGYWDLLRKDLIMPEFSTLNRSQIDDIWCNCMAMQLEPGTDHENRHFTIMDMGAKLIELYNENLTGKRITPKQKQFKAASLIKKSGAVIVQPAPLLDEGKFINDKNAVVKYRSCIVPFGNPHTMDVTHLLIGMSWREF